MCANVESMRVVFVSIGFQLCHALRFRAFLEPGWVVRMQPPGLNASLLYSAPNRKVNGKLILTQTYKSGSFTKQTPSSMPNKASLNPSLRTLQPYAVRQLEA